MKTTVEFYFDPISPYAWLAAEQIDRITEAGGKIVCRPILLAALLNANGTKGPAEVPSKRAYTFRDVMRQAKRPGLSFRGPPSLRSIRLPRCKQSMPLKTNRND